MTAFLFVMTSCFSQTDALFLNSWISFAFEEVACSNIMVRCSQPPLCLPTVEVWEHYLLRNHLSQTAVSQNRKQGLGLIPLFLEDNVNLGLHHCHCGNGGSRATTIRNKEISVGALCWGRGSIRLVDELFRNTEQIMTKHACRGLLRKGKAITL